MRFGKPFGNPSVPMAPLLGRQLAGASASLPLGFTYWVLLRLASPCEVGPPCAPFCWGRPLLACAGRVFSLFFLLCFCPSSGRFARIGMSNAGAAFGSRYLTSSFDASWKWIHWPRVSKNHCAVPLQASKLPGVSSK